MGVTHRVLYVGIGGTGVHIGKELEVALRRDRSEKVVLSVNSPLTNYLTMFSHYILILMMMLNKFFKKEQTSTQNLLKKMQQ